MRYDSVKVHIGRYGNQVSAGTIETLWLTRTKTPAHRPRKMNHNNAPQNCNTSTLSRRVTKYYFTQWRIMLWILICALSLWYHLSSQKSEERENRSYGVSFIYRRCICFHRILKSAATKSLYVCYFYQVHNLVCSNYCGATTITWKICFWFDRRIVRSK